MNKNEFLQSLETELAGLSADERVAALQYYTEYLDEAGPEREAEVLEELGSPGQVALAVKAASDEEEGWTPPVAPSGDPAKRQAAAERARQVQQPAAGQEPELTLFPQNVYDEDLGAGAEKQPAEAVQQPAAGAPAEPARQPDPGQTTAGQSGAAQAGAPINQMPPPPTYPPPPAYQASGAAQPLSPSYPAAQPGASGSGQASSGSSALRIVLIVIAAIFLSPLLIGIAGALFGFAVAAIVMLIVPFICGIAFVPSGLLLFVLGILFLPTSAGSGLFAMGSGLLLTGLGLLIIYAGVWLIRKAIPAVWRGLRGAFTGIANLFRNGRRQHG